MNNEQKTCSKMKSSTTEKQRSISINIVAGYTSILKRYVVVELLWLNRWFQYQYISRAPHKKGRKKSCFTSVVLFCLSVFNVLLLHENHIFRSIGTLKLMHRVQNTPSQLKPKHSESESFRLRWIWAHEQKSLNWHSEKKQITQMK